MRILAGMLCAATLLLGGCASIPLSTAFRLSRMTPQSLAQVDPAQLRVRLSVPAGFEINIDACRLDLVITGESGSRSSQMGLRLLSTTAGLRPGGLFHADIPVATYLLALQPEGMQELRELQQFIPYEGHGSFSFNVMAPMSTVPDGAREITFWADLKLSSAQPFMPLIDGARIKIKDTPEDG